jgi:hypothetical protein
MDVPILVNLISVYRNFTNMPPLHCHGIVWLLAVLRHGVLFILAAKFWNLLLWKCCTVFEETEDAIFLYNGDFVKNILLKAIFLV